MTNGFNSNHFSNNVSITKLYFLLLNVVSISMFMGFKNVFKSSIKQFSFYFSGNVTDFFSIERLESLSG